MIVGRGLRGGRIAWSGQGAVGMMCRHLRNCNIDLCPDQCLVSVRFMHGAIMDCYFIQCIFSCFGWFYCVMSVLLHMYSVMRVCWFVCSSLMLRIFGMLSLQNRLSNSKLHYEFMVLYFWFSLSLGIPQFLFKVTFVAVILSTHSSLVFVCVGCYCDRFLFVGMVHQTLRKLGRCQMTQLL